MKHENDRVEKCYGVSKTSYRASIDQNGMLVVKICHENQGTRNLINTYSDNPAGLLSRFKRLSKSRTRAEYYLSEVIDDYWNHFENNRVKFIWC
jgi:hypothetical protein